MRRHNGDVFQCPLCHSSQTCRWQLQRHLESKHFYSPADAAQNLKEEQSLEIEKGEIFVKNIKKEAGI